MTARASAVRYSFCSAVPVVGAVIAASLAPSADAALLITSLGTGDAAIPTTFADTSRPFPNSPGDEFTANTTTRFRTNGGDRDTGQIFTASASYELDSIVVRTGTGTPGAAAAGADFSVQFYSVDSSNAFSLLFTESGTLPGTLSSNEYLLLNISDANQPNLVAGLRYAYLLYFDVEAANRELALASNDENIYLGGQAIRREFGGDGPRDLSQLPVAAGSGTDFGKDYEFYTVAVPEPGSAALAALGGVMLLRRRRQA